MNHDEYLEKQRVEILEEMSDVVKKSEEIGIDDVKKALVELGNPKTKAEFIDVFYNADGSGKFSSEMYLAIASAYRNNEIK